MKSPHALAATLLGIALSAVASSAEKVATMPAPTGYVDDYANVLSAPARSQLEDLCKEIHEKTKAQVFFVTVNTLDGETMEPFANELFHKWKIGEKKTDRGILLVLSIAEHQRRIEVGFGLEGILNDAKVGDIGREMVPALKDNSYDEAARIGVTDVSKAIATDAGVTLDKLAALDQPPSAPAGTQPIEVKQTDGKNGIPWFFAAAPFLLFFGLFGFYIRRLIQRGTRFESGTGLPTGGSGFISSDSSSSAFSSSDSSSSSDSFSGGDGGDSGGGGAGGSW